MIKKNTELVVDVTDLNSEGKGVSKLDDGFVIFSDSTLPGDKALVKIRKVKSNYAEARLQEIIERSDLRVDPKCRYYGACGGCKIQNYDYNGQLEFKSNTVKDALLRIGKFRDIVTPGVIGGGDIFFYRNKMEFSFSDDEWIPSPEFSDATYGNQKFALGLHVPKFHSKIINIEECWLQSHLSNNILNFTRKFFKEKNISVYSTNTQSGFLRFLVIRQCKNTKDVMVNLITYSYDHELITEYSKSLQLAFPDISTIINSTTTSKAQVAFGEKEFVLAGEGFILEKLRRIDGEEFDFRISSKSFFQTNTSQAEKLFDTVVSLSGFNRNDNVLDLYCGTGSISIFISDLVKRVTGIELVNESVEDAKTNASLNNITNADFHCADILEFLKDNNSVSGYNKLILDPPRSGLHPKICEILAETRFEKIIYVSCNPQTQSRDLQIICRNGNYVIENIQPVDMFPHTYHVENIVSLIPSQVIL